MLNSLAKYIMQELCKVYLIYVRTFITIFIQHMPKEVQIFLFCVIIGAIINYNHLIFASFDALGQKIIFKTLKIDCILSTFRKL